MVITGLLTAAYRQSRDALRQLVQGVSFEHYSKYGVSPGSTMQMSMQTTHTLTLRAAQFKHRERFSRLSKGPSVPTAITIYAFGARLKSRHDR